MNNWDATNSLLFCPFIFQSMCCFIHVFLNYYLTTVYFYNKIIYVFLSKYDKKKLKG